jgi:MFS family permease
LPPHGSLLQIISTALPTIAAELGATPSQYSWVGTAYLLSQTLMTPINGRVTDIIGRKPALYASIVVLLVFSAMCGAAKSITWWVYLIPLTQSDSDSDSDSEVSADTEPG